jgi:hypothetical protein
VSDLDLRRRLLSVQPPDELEAERRSWNVIRSAWETREPLAAKGGRGPILVAALVAGAAVVGAFALTPAGGAVGGWIKNTLVGRSDARPALDSLPTPGNLLVSSAQGVWVVHPDGSKRRLGNYRQGSWSPRGLFVAATGGHQLVALEPDGDVRWTISRPQPVADARWLPKTGFRIAYRAGPELRVVGGDGKGDRRVAERAAPVAPAWRPVEERLLAYGDDAGRVHLVETDTRRERWRTGPAQPVRGLEWSKNGKWLLAWSPNLIRVYGAGGRLDSAIPVPKRTHSVLAATFKPGTRSIAYAVFEGKTGKSSVLVYKRNSIERFSGVGRFTKLTWSPDRKWLLVSWPSADQWVFLEIPGGVRRIDAVGGIAAEFDPGAAGDAFPLVEGWCCGG